ncbi:MAG: glycosyltransferase family 4 protein [Hyphomicrobiales bacterium]|nr:glycosyltransferase family 4 protein [Hyphomicrobiales bacterium]
MAAKNRRILIIVENLTIPIDRRVWQEASALRDAGYVVSVICPVGGRHTARYELLEGVHVFRHPIPYDASTAAGYIVEYLSALFWEFVLAWRVLFKPGFDVIHACNPPDTIFSIGLFFKLFFRKKFVFDQHDLTPELYPIKFGREGLVHRVLMLLERLTFAVADASIATNETFKKIAVERGGMRPERVFIVQSTPDISRFKRFPADSKLRNGREQVVGYVGIMAEQDGVDLLLKAIEHLVTQSPPRNIQCLIVGSGPQLENLQDMARELDLEGHITFTGYLSGEDLLRAFSTFDVGVIPDPKNNYNDKVSMNKVFEYMALGIPFVQFDLTENMKISGDVPLYATNNDPVELARKIEDLLDNPSLRQEKADAGKIRLADVANWAKQEEQLLAAYSSVFEK